MPCCNDQIDHFSSKKSPVDSREIIYSVSIMNVDPSRTDDGGEHGYRLLWRVSNGLCLGLFHMIKRIYLKVIGDQNSHMQN